MSDDGWTPTDVRPAQFTGVRAWPAEGARVGLITCLDCGASLLLDPANDFDVTQRHIDWHLAASND